MPKSQKFKCDILSIFQTIWLCWEIMLLKILTIFLNVGSSVDAIVLEKVLKFLHLWKSNECRGCWPHFSEFSAVYAAKRGSTTSLLVSFLLLLLLLAWSWSWPSPRLPHSSALCFSSAPTSVALPLCYSLAERQDFFKKTLAEIGLQ